MTANGGGRPGWFQKVSRAEVGEKGLGPGGW